MNRDIPYKIAFPLILDGGLSNVLEDMGCDLNHKLWTAHILDQKPKAIVEAHLAYIKSGAQCITSSSYQVSLPGLIDLGFTKKKAENLLVKSVKLAVVSIQKALDSGLIRAKPLIAASIGPYGAYLADGSEYRGNYGIKDEDLKVFHQERIQILDQTNADLLACETIPSLQEAQILSDILMNVKKPAWISFSCKDKRHLNDGSCICECVSIFKDHPKVFAIGVNCTKPEYISDIIKQIKALEIGKKIIVYPNSGEAYLAESKSWIGLSEPLSYAKMAKEWLKFGADIVGGCCRIGPEQIKQLREMIVSPTN